MTLSRPYADTVRERAERDPEFRAAMIAEWAKLEDKILRMLAAVEADIPPGGAEDVREFIRRNEYGLALATLCDVVIDGPKHEDTDPALWAVDEGNGA